MTFEQELRKSNNSWYEKGIEQGKVETKKDVVLGMKEEGLSIDQISKIVKLSISQVNEIISSNLGKEKSI